MEMKMHAATDAAEALDAVACLLAEAQSILFITGAGISVDSGLPTYRGIGGLYHQRLTDEGLSIEEALSGHMMAQRPDITWKYIAEIEAGCRDAQPNAAHRVIAALERDKPAVWTLTQNVDGLHRLAGSSKLIEIHGTVHRLLCTECSHQRTVTDFAGLTLPPSCPACGGLLRPAIVLFGEALPTQALNRLEEVLLAGVDAVVSIGTSSVFPYISGPVRWARQVGIPTVEIDPGTTEISPFVDHRLPLGAAAAMSELWRRLYPDRPFD